MAYRTCTEEGINSRRGVNGTRLRQWGVQGYAQKWQIPGIYRSIYLLRGARRTYTLIHSKLGDRPPTGELTRRSFVPLTTYYCCSRHHYVRSCGLLVHVAGPVLWYYYGRPCQAGGGTAIYCPLCLVLYSREGTALYRPFVRFSMAEGGDGSLPSPSFGFIWQRGGRLSTVPCVRLYI